MIPLARRLVLAVALASMTTGPRVWAQTQTQTQGATTPAPRRVVVVHVMGSPEETRDLEATIRELYAQLHLTMATGSAPAASILETVTIDLTGTYGTKIIVRSASGTTILDRTVQRGDTAAIQREQVAHAVRGAAEAEILVDEDRVAGRAPAVVDEPAPPPLPAPPPPAPPPAVAPPLPVVTTVEAPITPPPKAERSPSWALDLATFAGAGLFADETSVVARVGGSVALASRRGLRPSIALSGLYAFPFESGDRTLTSRTNLFSLRLMPGLGLFQSGRFGLDAAAGGGIDVITVNPVSSVLPDSALGQPTTRVNGILSAAVSGRFAIASDVSITLTAMLDIDPSSRTYVFDDRAQRTEVFSPWSFRPMLLAGLAFTALGSGR